MNDNKTSKNSIVAKFAVPISFLILFFLAANFTDCDLVTFWKRKSHLTDLVVDMIPPDFSYIQKILLPLFYTIQMSVTGTVLGTFFALVLSPFGAANLEFPAVMRRILRIVIQILRSFPALILALTATFLFGLGTFAGTFAITLYTFAIMTKLTYEDASAAGKKRIRHFGRWVLRNMQLISMEFYQRSFLDFSPMPFTCWRPMYGTALFWDMWELAGSGCFSMKRFPGWSMTRLEPFC